MSMSEWRSDVGSPDLGLERVQGGRPLACRPRAWARDVEPIHGTDGPAPRIGFPGFCARPARLRRQRKTGSYPVGSGTGGCLGRVDERLRSLPRSEEHTSELQSLMSISYAVFCSKKKTE